MILATGLGETIDFILEQIVRFAPQITVILASYLAIVGTRKQSAREYLAKSRSDSLNKTKDYFSEFVTITYRIWGFKVNGSSYKNSIEAIDRKNIAVLNLETAFNPDKELDAKIINLIKEIEKRTMSLEGEIIADGRDFGKRNDENSDIIDSEIKPLMDELKTEIQKYFNQEWEQIKHEIKFKK